MIRRRLALNRAGNTSTGYQFCENQPTGQPEASGKGSRPGLLFWVAAASDNPAMRILITGATGFVGRRLAEVLLADGEDIRLFVRDRARLAPVLRVASDIFEVDLRSLRNILRLMLEQHPDGPLPKLRGISRLLAHDSILSSFGVSGKAGAVHFGLLTFRITTPWPSLFLQHSFYLRRI